MAPNASSPLDAEFSWLNVLRSLENLEFPLPAVRRIPKFNRVYWWFGFLEVADNILPVNLFLC